MGKNAEMVGWGHYHINTCPFPLAVGLERFHTPQGLKHAGLLRLRWTPAPGLDLLRFSTLSSYGKPVIRLAEPVSPQLVLRLFKRDQFSHLQAESACGCTIVTLGEC